MCAAGGLFASQGGKTTLLAGFQAPSDPALFQTRFPWSLGHFSRPLACVSECISVHPGPGSAPGGKEHSGKLIAWFRAEFLNLTLLAFGTGGGCCPVQWRMFSSIPGLYPLGASSPRHHPVVTTPNLSRHCQMSPERQSHPIEKHRGREDRSSSPRTPSALVSALMCESYTKHKHESYILHFFFQPVPQAEPRSIHLPGVFPSGWLQGSSPGSARTRLRVASRWRRNPSQASVDANFFSGSWVSLRIRCWKGL